MKVQTNWHIIRDLGHGDSSLALEPLEEGRCTVVWFRT